MNIKPNDIIDYVIVPMEEFYSDLIQDIMEEPTTEDNPDIAYWNIIGISNDGKGRCFIAQCMYKEDAILIREALMKPIREKENYLNTLKKYKKD
jgi:hypothetical protein